MSEKTAEVRLLEYQYQKKTDQIFVLYGTKGCGKEEYLREFLKEKDYFYYRARELSDLEQKRVFIRELQEKYSKETAQTKYLECLQSLLEDREGKFVLVIDEFQYLIKKDSDFIQTLSQLKKTEAKSGGTLLILLCSSSVVWVEQKMQAALKDAFFLIDDIHKITEKKFLDIVRRFPDYGVSECVEVYGIIGGMEEYLNCWDGEKSTKENVCEQILSADGRLFGEAEQYIRMELRELSVYNTILSAIASGHRKLNELYQLTGYSRAKISVYMKHLMELGVIEKVVSFETGGWENAQKGIYQIRHTFINFWFKFVFPHLSDLYLHTPQEFYDRHIEGALEEYLNRYFISVCMEYMELLDQIHKLPVEIKKIGTWIGKQGNIDIIAQNSIRENVVGICNWSEEKMSYARYEQLEELLKQARIKAKHYFLFSAKAFDEELIKKSEEDERFSLIDMTEL